LIPRKLLLLVLSLLRQRWLKQKAAMPAAHDAAAGENEKRQVYSLAFPRSNRQGGRQAQKRRAEVAVVEAETT
jgi:hypothetical protein